MRRAIRFGATLLIFGLLEGTDYLQAAPTGLGWFEDFKREVGSTIASPTFQRFEVTCLATYVAGFFLVNLRRAATPTGAKQRVNWNREVLSNILLGVFCAAVVLHSFLNSSFNRNYTDAIVVLVGIVIGQAVLLAKRVQPDAEQAMRVQEDILNVLTILLSVSVLIRPEWWEKFPYHGQTRWQGPWWNPNHFGLLMGAGVTLATGQGLRQWSKVLETQERNLQILSSMRLGFYATAGVLMSVGLLKSYSRGAWAGAALGMLYLVSQWLREAVQKWKSGCEVCPHEIMHRRFRPSLLVAVAICSLLTIGYWSFRHTKHLPVRRAFSVGNVNDFSGQRRLVAYEGAMQLMSSKPWFGFGWDAPKIVYDQLYRPNKLDEGKAIELNDFFMIGMTLGVPAMGCFLGYICLSLWPRSRFEEANKMASWALKDANKLRAISRAAVIVFVVGFWLDRGLFWMALTVPFWVLLELGSLSASNGES